MTKKKVWWRPEGYRSEEERRGKHTDAVVKTLWLLAIITAGVAMGDVIASLFR